MFEYFVSNVHLIAISACKYTHGNWSDCDPTTNLRSRTRTLLKGDEKNCKQEEVVSKPCTKRDGEGKIDCLNMIEKMVCQILPSFRFSVM